MSLEVLSHKPENTSHGHVEGGHDDMNIRNTNNDMFTFLNRKTLQPSPFTMYLQMLYSNIP